VRSAHATSGDYSNIRPRSEFDGFCGVRPRLEPKDLGADRDRLSRDGLGLCRGTEYVDDVDRHVDLV
jgi:hypothetical protein